MQAFELKMKDLLKILPREALDEILKKLQENHALSGIKRVKRFVKEYDNDNMPDFLLSHVLNDVINTIGCALEKDLRVSKKRGDQHYCGRNGAKIIVEKLHEIAARIEEASSEEKCDQEHDDDDE